MVIGCHLIISSQLTVFQKVKLIAKVMPSVSANSIPIKVFPAYRTDKYRSSTKSTSLFYILAQILFVGSACCRATIVCAVCLCLVTDTLVICLQLIAITTVALLIVMGKLYQNIVAWLNLFLHRLPIRAFHIEALATGTVLCTVVYRNVAFEKLLEHLSPSTCYRCTLIIGCHRGITDSMNLTRLNTKR